MPVPKHTIPHWREFERLVALLESHFRPQGAIIKSPDHILDKITGELRQVDASIRLNEDSTPVLITIECRKRKAKPDTTWIEQLNQKHIDIGASFTIAVSSAPFTEPALKKARYYGIETRLLKEISEETVKAWASTLSAVYVKSKFGLRRLGIKFKDFAREQSPDLTPEILNEYSKGDVEYKFIRRLADSVMISIGDLLREHETKTGNQIPGSLAENVTVRIPPRTTVGIIISSKFSTLFEGVPINGEPVTKILSWKFEPQEAAIATVIGPLEIEQLDVEFQIIQRTYPTQLGQLLSYNNNQGFAQNVEVRDITFDDQERIQIIIT